MLPLLDPKTEVLARGALHVPDCVVRVLRLDADLVNAVVLLLELGAHLLQHRRLTYQSTSTQMVVSAGKSMQ